MRNMIGVALTIALTGCAVTTGAHLDADVAEWTDVRRWNVAIQRPWSEVGECLYREYEKIEIADPHGIAFEYVEFSSSETFDLKSYLGAGMTSKSYLAHIRGRKTGPATTEVEIAAATTLWGDGWSKDVDAIFSACST